MGIEGEKEGEGNGREGHKRGKGEPREGHERGSGTVSLVLNQRPIPHCNNRSREWTNLSLPHSRPANKSNISAPQSTAIPV